MWMSVSQTILVNTMPTVQTTMAPTSVIVQMDMRTKIVPPLTAVKFRARMMESAAFKTVIGYATAMITMKVGHKINDL